MSEVSLKTERVILRRFTLADARPLLEMDSNPAVQRYLDMQQQPTLEGAYGFIEYVLNRYPVGCPHGYWAAELADGSNAWLGWFHFRPHRKEPELIELGYRLCEEHWGRGYATEVSRALIENSDARTIVAETLVDNLGSRRVMEKVGMTVASEFMYDDRLPAIRYALSR